MRLWERRFSLRRLCRSCGFLRDNVQHCLFVAAQNRQSNLCPYLLFGQEPMKIVNARYRTVSVTDNQVAFFEPSALRRSVGFQRNHQDTARHRQVVQQHLTTVEHNVLSGNADLSAPDLAVSYEKPGDKLCRVDRGGKA